MLLDDFNDRVPCGVCTMEMQEKAMLMCVTSAFILNGNFSLSIKLNEVAFMKCHRCVCGNSLGDNDFHFYFLNCMLIIS